MKTEKELMAAFQQGEFSTQQFAWMVKDGSYFWAAAEKNEFGVYVPTEFGERLLAEAAAKPAPAEPPVEAPAEEAPAEEATPAVAESVESPEVTPPKKRK